MIAIIKQHISILTFTVLMSLLSCAEAQENLSKTHSLIGGNWNVCVGDSVSRYFRCSSEWIFANFKFEHDGKLIDREKSQSFTGHYEFNDTSLTIKIPKAQNTSLDFINFKIVWMDDNRFYSIQKGDISGIAVYYFERETE